MSANNEDATKIIEYLEKVETLKRSEKVETVVDLIPKIQASYTQVPSHFNKSKSVSIVRKRTSI